MKTKKKLLGLFIASIPLIALVIAAGLSNGWDDVIHELVLLGIASGAVICFVVGISLLDGDL
jgi:hypothetical protein